MNGFPTYASDTHKRMMENAYHSREAIYNSVWPMYDVASCAVWVTRNYKWLPYQKHRLGHDPGIWIAFLNSIAWYLTVFRTFNHLP